MTSRGYLATGEKGTIGRRGFLRAATAALGAGAAVPVAGGCTPDTGRAPRERPAPPPGDQPALPPGEWTLDPARSDEFDGDRWDPSRWATDHWTSGGGGIHFDPERATVHDGRLHIEVRRPAGSGPWRAGLLHSLFTIGAETYLEVQAKMIPFAANVNSAIWVQQQAGPAAGGNLNVEIDLQEYHQDNPQAGRRNVRSSAHLWQWTPQPPPHADLTPKMGRSFPTGVDLDAGFHRYGLERRNGEVNLYLDGRLLRQLHREIADPAQRELLATQERRLILACNGLAPGEPEAEGDMQIDYVRVYRAGPSPGPASPTG